jgi:hypothetical protein
VYIFRVQLYYAGEFQINATSAAAAVAAAAATTATTTTTITTTSTATTTDSVPLQETMCYT